MNIKYYPLIRSFFNIISLFRSRSDRSSAGRLKNILLLFVLLFSACNLSYEDAQDKTWSASHPAKPPFSGILHGNDYRFPAGSCTEPECHGSDLRGGNTGSPSCYSCHGGLWTVFSSSHTRNVNGIYHHYAVDDGNFTADCAVSGCHGDGTNLYTENLTGYDYRYACYSCHDPIPPPGHRISEEGVLHHKDIGKDPAVYCYKSGCHDITGAGPGPRCSSCHDSDYPTDDK